MAIAISEVQGTIAVALAGHVFAARAKAPKLFAVLRVKCVDARPRQAAHEGAGFTSHRPHDLGKGEAGIPRATKTRPSTTIGFPIAALSTRARHRSLPVTASSA